MYVLGFAFSPQHGIIGVLDGSRYHLHYLLPTTTATEAGAARDALKQYLTEKTYKQRVLCVRSVATLVNEVKLLRKFARAVYAVLVFDAAPQLLQQHIPIIDGIKGADDQWWRNARFFPTMLPARLAVHTNTVKLSRLRKRTTKKPATDTVKVRGELAHVAQAVTQAVEGKKRVVRVLRTIFGWLLGTVATKTYRRIAADLLLRFKLPAELLQRVIDYHRGPKGRALHTVFYRMQRGHDFRELQVKYKHLDMDDWLVVNDYWPAVEKHALVARPPR